jgi:ABC-type transporter Mla subunit MlaD
VSEGLSINDVVSRFGDATVTLEALGERLQALSLAEEAAAEQSESLKAAAEAAQSLAGELGNLTSSIREAIAPLVDALEAGRGMIASADLGPMANDLAALRAQVESQGQVLDSRLGQFTETLAEREDLGRRLEESDARYASLLAKLTPKQQAKLGL